MRVLLTTDTIGGVWTFTTELSTELLDQGHQVALVGFGATPSRGQSDWAAHMASLFPGSFRFELSDIPLEWMDGNERTLSEGSAVLHRVVAEFEPDLLHSNQFCFGALPLRIPKLVTAHGDVLSWAAACRAEALEDSDWLNRCVGLIRDGLAGADAVSAPTCWMAEELWRHFPSAPKAAVILNGRTLPALTGNHERKLQAVSAGRLWDEAKNTSLLLEVRSPMPILLVGHRKLGEVEAEFASPFLTLVGALPEAELLPLFRGSSVYLATSRYEPFGLAPLEAGLCGCAVLANDIPPFHEIWGDAAAYFSDPRSLEILLYRLAENPTELAAMQERSLARAGQLTRSRTAAKYLGLYERLCEAGPTHKNGRGRSAAHAV